MGLAWVHVVLRDLQDPGMLLTSRRFGGSSFLPVRRSTSMNDPVATIRIARAVTPSSAGDRSDHVQCVPSQRPWEVAPEGKVDTCGTSAGREDCWAAWQPG